MNNTLLISLIICIIYLIFRFLEMRFILKENKPLKELIKDSLFVYVSALIGFFIIDQFKNIMDIENNIKITPIAFTNDAPF